MFRWVVGFDGFPGFKDRIDVLDNGGADAKCSGDEEAEHLLGCVIIFRLNLYTKYLADFLMKPSIKTEFFFTCKDIFRRPWCIIL